MIDKMNKIHNIDCLEFMKQVPDNYFDMIYIDPPYFEVKGDFDFIWKDFDDYLEWMETLTIEFKRILSDKGSLFLWGNSKKIAYKQIIFDKYFNLENNLVWRKKDSIQYQYYSPDLARSFNTHNERCLFYSNIIDYKNNPIAEYLKSEFKKHNISNREVSALFPSASGGLTGCVSNWINGDNVITEQQYLKVREHFKDNILKENYKNLIERYNDFIRPFYNASKLEDVLDFSQESNITRAYKHPTQKSPRMTAELLRITTRKDSKVFIPFVGSGTEAEACKSLGLDWCGCELEPDYVEIANKRLSAVQGSLF